MVKKFSQFTKNLLSCFDSLGSIGSSVTPAYKASCTGIIYSWTWNYWVQSTWTSRSPLCLQMTSCRFIELYYYRIHCKMFLSLHLHHLLYHTRSNTRVYRWCHNTAWKLQHYGRLWHYFRLNKDSNLSTRLSPASPIPDRQSGIGTSSWINSWSLAHLPVSISGCSNEGRVSGHVTASIDCRVVLWQEILHTLILALLEWNGDE